MKWHGVVFSSLPYDLQLPVIKKLTFQEFCRLFRCNSLAFDVCHSHKFKLNFDIEEIILSQDKEEVNTGKERVPLEEVLASPARIRAAQIVFKHVLTEENCNKLIKQFKQGKSSAKKIVIWEKPECKPDTLADLIKFLNITHLETRVNLGALFFEHDVFLQLEDLALRCCSCDCLVHFQVKRAAITTHVERPVPQLIMRKHIEEEWIPQGGHLRSY